MSLFYVLGHDFYGFHAHWPLIANYIPQFLREMFVTFYHKMLIYV